MRILAIDTATSACSVALWQDGAVIASRFESMTRGHAERLVPMIAAVLAQAGLDAGALDRLAVTVGPGAFTGLRVGLAAARGLALAISRPLVGLTTFEVIAHAVPADERRGRDLLVVVDSRRAEPFVQRFDADLVPVGEPCLMRPEACRQALAPGALLVIGDGAGLLRQALAGRPDTRFADRPGLPDAAVAAALAATLAPGAGRPPRPLYLRPPDARLPDARLPDARLPDARLPGSGEGGSP